MHNHHNNKGSHTLTGGISRGDRLKKAADSLEKQISQRVDQIKTTVSGLDKKVRDNPWPTISGVAAACLVAGFVMGMTKRSK